MLVRAIALMSLTLSQQEPLRDLWCALEKMRDVESELMVKTLFPADEAKQDS